MAHTQKRPYNYTALSGGNPKYADLEFSWVDPVECAEEALERISTYHRLAAYINVRGTGDDKTNLAWKKSGSKWQKVDPSMVDELVDIRLQDYRSKVASRR